MADLKTNYVDDVLDTTKNQLRKYQQIQNDDGTVSFVDVTEYTQVGTSFGAKDINDTNAAINDVNGKLNNRIATVTGTTDASGAGTVIYPNGFNINNCVIISCELTYRANEIYSFPYDNNQSIQYVQKNYSGVTIYVNSGSFADCKFSVTFLKL